MGIAESKRLSGLQLFVRYLACVMAAAIAFSALANRWCSEQCRSYDSFSAQLIVDSVIRYQARGDADVGGFMTAFEKSVHIATVEYIDGRKGARQAYPYVSNFNLQYTLAKQFPAGDPAVGPLALPMFSLLCALGMAMVVAGLATFAHRQFGRLSAAAVVLAFAASPPLILHALNPYWMIFLGFLPMLAMLTLYPQARSPARFAALGALAGLLVCLKCLTGYEYISAIGLGAALPVLYFELAASERWDFAIVRRILGRGLVVGTFVAAGFGAAAAMHVWKAALLFGSFDKGMMALTVPFSYTTWESSTGIRGNVGIVAHNVIAALADTFLWRNMPVALAIQAGLVVTFLLLILRFAGSLPQLWSAMERAHRALVVTWLAAIPASLSWMALATRHSIVHPHINWILGYMFMNLFAAMLVGRNLTMLWTARAGEVHQSPA